MDANHAHNAKVPHDQRHGDVVHGQVVGLEDFTKVNEAEQKQ